MAVLPLDNLRFPKWTLTLGFQPSPHRRCFLLALWLAKNLILTLLKQSVEHEFDKKLEGSSRPAACKRDRARGSSRRRDDCSREPPDGCGQATTRSSRSAMVCRNELGLGAMDLRHALDRQFRGRCDARQARSQRSQAV